MTRLLLLCTIATASPAAAAPPTLADVDGAAAARIVTSPIYDGALRAEDPALRAGAVRALGRLQSAVHLAALERALDDPDFTVREAAAFAWGQLEGAPAKPLVARVEKEVAPPVRVRMVEALGKLAQTDEAALLRAADDADPEVRRAARIGLALLARRRDGDLPPLTARLPDWLAEPHRGARFAAAYALMRAEKLTAPSILTAAQRCAKDGDAEIRALCVRALGRFEAAAAAPLREATGDPDWRVAVEAWRAGTKAKVLPALAGGWNDVAPRVVANPSLLTTPRVHVWNAALEAALAAPIEPALDLSARAFARAVLALPAVAPAQARGRAHLRCRAAAVLDRLDPGDRLATCDPAAPVGLRPALLSLVLGARPGPARAAEIVRRYPSADPPTRLALLDLVAELKGEAGMTGVVDLAVADPDPAVLSQGAMAAGKLAHRAAAKALRQRVAGLFERHEYEALITVFDALGGLADADAKPLLQAALTYPNAAIADAAAAALKALGVVAVAAPAARPARPVTAIDAETAIVDTDKGQFTLRLLGADAPLTVANFVGLAEKRFYDGLRFHRVVSDFVVQGGDPRGDGWGGPGYAIPCEINAQPYATGAVGMALAGKDTGGSQWFVTHAPQPHLDGRYTVFAQVISGMEVVDALVEGDAIRSVEVGRSP